MARVTSEDCIDKVSNRFELVLLSAHRARGMSVGAELLVERDNDKNPVVALREIAEKKLVPDEVREDIIASLQKQVDIDEPQEDFLSGPALSRPRAQPDDQIDRNSQTAMAIISEDAATAVLSEEVKEMKEMSEDDILAALRALEANTAKDDSSD